MHGRRRMLQGQRDHVLADRVGMGARLLEKWVLLPLKDVAQIQRRLNTVEALIANQDLLQDIAAGRCVRTLYLTAGDANDTQQYWESREAGVQAAYAAMRGVENTWTTTDAGVAGHPIPVRTLAADAQGPAKDSAVAQDSVDVGFSRDMQDHHAQAVEMSVMVREATDDPQVRTLALDIMLTQQQQLGQQQMGQPQLGQQQMGQQMDQTQPQGQFQGAPTSGTPGAQGGQPQEGKTTLW